ncbi:PLP-dependent aminotransferase family protein [Agrobacterium vitis]
MIEALRIAIREGRLSQGSQVPSSRDLAGQWGVSRGLISAAYEELQTEGLLESFAGSGTYVASGMRLQDKPSSTDTLPGNESQGFSIDEHPTLFRLNPERPFIARETDVSLFPVRTWRKLAQRALSEIDNSFFYDPDPAGYQELRSQISRYLGFARGITCDADDIVITTGTRHSLDLCLRTLTRPGDKVWTEMPGYAGAEALIGIHDLTSVPISIDAHGFRVEIAKEIAPNAKLCIVTPSHHSPLGVRLSFERRQKLLAWAVRADAYIIEDDYDGEFSFESVRFPAFKAMDVDDRVIHAGSFNKVLFPTLRIGYLVAPKSLRANIVRLRGETGRNNSALDQRILAYFFSDGHFSQHIRRMGRVYHEKCQISIASIRDSYGEYLNVFGDHGGFHFCVALPSHINLEYLHSRCRLEGFTIQTAQLQAAAGIETALVVGYSSLTIETIKRTGSLLGKILRECRG